MKSYLRAISYYLPVKILTNEELSIRFPAIRIDDLTRLTGVTERHIAAENETAADMAVKAAKTLFDEHSIEPSEVDFILLNTQWSDYITPSSSCIIQDRLGIPKTAGSLDISQGCTGFIYALSVARGMIETGTASNVLVLTAETITRSIHDDDHSNRAIFGDGAAAILVSAAGEGDGWIGEFIFGTDGKGAEDIMIRTGGARYPRIHLSTDNPEMHGSLAKEEAFHMNGQAVFTFSVNVTPGLIEEILKKNHLDRENIDFYIFHQANRIILETIIRKNRIPSGRTIIHLDKVGNTVSSTIPIALYHAIREGSVKRGDRILLAAFGVGLSWGGTVIQF